MRNSLKLILVTQLAKHRFFFGESDAVAQCFLLRFLQKGHPFGHQPCRLRRLQQQVQHNIEPQSPCSEYAQPKLEMRRLPSAKKRAEEHYQSRLLLSHNTHNIWESFHVVYITMVVRSFLFAVDQYLRVFCINDNEPSLGYNISGMVCM